jgi:osmotically-inducible protein OsmY
MVAVNTIPYGNAEVAPAPPDFGELAESRLRRNAYLALKNVSCQYQDGVLVLRGWVPTYYLKQVASATVAGLSGVRYIVNQIDVGAAASR